VNRVLVTGASGFIGRVLCARLKRDGVGVRALMRHTVSGPWDEAWALDLGREPAPPSLLEGVDTVFHLAGKAHAVSERPGDGEEHQRITVEGTRLLLAAATDSDIARLVFFSSVKVMGERTESCEDESTPCLPETPYARARLAAEKLVKDFGDASDVHVVNLRLPLVYGRGSKGNLDRMFASVAAGRFPSLPEIGNKRSMVHVDDVVEMAMCASETPQAAGQTYIVTDGRSYSTREIYEMMCEVLGKQAAWWSIPVPVLRLLARLGDVIGAARRQRFVFDSEAWRKLSESAWYSSAKAARELGFRPSRSLHDALPEMVVDLRRVD
jgi:nucleoside-diphosphate-sugar epimerase